MSANFFARPARPLPVSAPPTAAGMVLRCEKVEGGRVLGTRARCRFSTPSISFATFFISLVTVAPPHTATPLVAPPWLPPPVSTPAALWAVASPRRASAMARGAVGGSCGTPRQSTSLSGACRSRLCVDPAISGSWPTSSMFQWQQIALITLYRLSAKRRRKRSQSKPSSLSPTSFAIDASIADTFVRASEQSRESKRCLQVSWVVRRWRWAAWPLSRCSS